MKINKILVQKVNKKSGKSLRNNIYIVNEQRIVITCEEMAGDGERTMGFHQRCK